MASIINISLENMVPMSPSSREQVSRFVYTSVVLNLAIDIHFGVSNCAITHTPMRPFQHALLRIHYL